MFFASVGVSYVADVSAIANVPAIGGVPTEINIFVPSTAVSTGSRFLLLWAFPDVLVLSCAAVCPAAPFVPTAVDVP
jgi:hypothetical protein